MRGVLLSRMLLTISLLIVICIFIWACDTSTEPDDPPVLRGTVYDRYGDPVPGAIIELEYFPDAGSSYVPKTALPLVSTMIRFTIPEPGPVKVWITRLGAVDTVKVLMDATVMAGSYAVQWNGANRDSARVINHIYQSHIWFNGAVAIDTFLVNSDYYGDVDPERLEYYTLSNAAGEFTVPAEQLACTGDMAIELTDELGNRMGTVKLSRSLRVWALHHAHGKTVTEQLFFKTEGATNAQLAF